VIVDHNAHPVPDGTPVWFIFTYPQEGLEHSVLVITRDGIAETSLLLDRAGQLDISIQADPAPRAIALQITIQEGEPATIVPVTPTPRPTSSPTPTLTPESGGDLEETPSPTPVPGSGGGDSTSTGLGVLRLVLASMGVLIISGTGYYVMRTNNESVRVALRLVLWCVTGGFGLYLVYVLLLPGVAWFQEQSSVWIAGWIAALGSLVPPISAWIARWWRARE
jgi:hypothetical protein